MRYTITKEDDGYYVRRNGKIHCWYANLSIAKQTCRRLILNNTTMSYCRLSQLVRRASGAKFIGLDDTHPDVEYRLLDFIKRGSQDDLSYAISYGLHQEDLLALGKYLGREDPSSRGHVYGALLRLPLGRFVPAAEQSLALIAGEMLP